jgi:citrate synthase
MADYLTAAEAARRLGVKPATLYAYVSRGVLSRVRAPDGRTSLFGAEEVEQLARRGRPRRPAGVVDITVESAITEITGDSLRFRGLDVTRLAVSRTFEEVAELLWTGEFPSGRESGREPWRAGPRRPRCPPGRFLSSGSRSSSRPWRRPTPSGSSSTAQP